ncbi:hypothetical protein JHK85_054198 [Glycine max]|nr:hypothetical protein JHK85_054198 [Glycine max]
MPEMEERFFQMEQKLATVDALSDMVETFTKVGQLEKASDAEQSIQVDGSNRGTGLSSPIPLPARPQRISTGRELFYQ